jgi:predicted ATPase
MLYSILYCNRLLARSNKDKLMKTAINSIGTTFTKQGYTCTRETAKLDEYQAPTTGQFIYHNKERATIQLVIDPGLNLKPFIELSGVSLKGVEKFYHHSNLRQFPKRKNRGKNEVHYGRALEIDSLDALTSFLQFFDTPAGSERIDADLPSRLTAIELENFKGIGERVRVELAPITLLFGANSAGKSTIIQAMQYVREVLERRNVNPDRTLYGGEFVDLGGFHNLVHQRDLTRSICIKLEMDLNRSSLPDLVPEAYDEWQTNDESVWEFSGLLQETKDRTNSVSIELKIGWSSIRQAALVIGYEVGINGEWIVRINSPEDGRDAEIKINPQNPVLMRYITQDDLESSQSILPDLELESSNESLSQSSDTEISNSDSEIENHGYSLLYEIVNNLEEAGIKGASKGFRQWLNTVDGALPTLAPLLYVPTGEAKGAEAVYIAREFTSFLSAVVVGPGILIRDQLRKLRYVGPIRNVPPRGFEASLTPDEARWADGTAAWETLLTGNISLVDEVSAWMSNEDKLATGYEVKRRAFKEVDVTTLNWLMRVADPDAGVRSDPEMMRQLERTPEKFQIDLVDIKTGMRVWPRDVGIGISQVLPVVVSALEPSASLVAIEQPELHIHPAVQVGLGDLLIKGAKEHGISFLIETHSEHLILRLLRRIRETAEDELPPGLFALNPEDVCVVYVQSGESGVELVPLPIDESGEFTTRWPKGFFDERAEELF